jgi:hypothetical protein
MLEFIVHSVYVSQKVMPSLEVSMRRLEAGRLDYRSPYKYFFHSYLQVVPSPHSDRIIPLPVGRPSKEESHEYNDKREPRAA